MAPAPITEKALNEKIMSLLTARTSCADARSIMLEPATVAGDADNWRIGHFDPGCGDRYHCKLALRAILADLRGQFAMIA